MATWLLGRSKTLTHHHKNLPFLLGSLLNHSHTSSSSSSFVKSRDVPHASQGNNSPTLSFFSRFESTKAEAQLELHQYLSEDDPNQVIDFPGGKVAFTSEMKFICDSGEKRVPCYRVLDDNGEPLKYSNYVQVSKEMAVKIYSDMVTLQTMDNIFYEVQRQGRISFYLTSMGEEAVNIASAAALASDDIVLPQSYTCTVFGMPLSRVFIRFIHVTPAGSLPGVASCCAFSHRQSLPTLVNVRNVTQSKLQYYREPGVLLWRGFTLQQFAHQCFGNTSDIGKGRQMPIHYGSNKLNYFTVSSPIGTQLPQAVGAAYSLKMDGKSACAVTYCGDGGTSEGDFHAGLNFAAVLEAPVIFICRNNGWAISTPVEEQFRSDGIVVKGKAYGIWSIRVDGNDALAVYSAVHTAREIAIRDKRPVLIEALTYRVGHHSTSDDSTKYRPIDEIEYWKMERNPVNRFKIWVERNGWWSEKDELELRSSVRKQLLQAIQVAEKAQKPPLEDMFNDVYDQQPSNLQEQDRVLRKTITKHPKDYPSDVPL